MVGAETAPMTANQTYFERHVQRQESGCWEWTGARNQYGYGRFGVDGKNKHAHRVAYELAVGPIPAGLVIDHLCRNRCCVNPSHMELVTLAENIRRGVHSKWKNRITHCPQGHEYSPENTEVKTLSATGGKSRVCKACRREARLRKRSTT